MTATDQAIELARIAARGAAGKLATDIVALDVSEPLTITDVFVLATGASERQVGAIVDGVDEVMHRAGSKTIRREGESEGRWVLLDYGDIIVHVQHTEDRAFYALDRLWRDCPLVDLQLPEDPAGEADATGTGSGTGSVSR